MTYQEAIEMMEKRKFGAAIRCHEETVQMCELAIKALEKQIPKKPYKDNENGVYEKEYCPACHRSLFPNDHHCICGQALDWGDE